MAIARTYGSFPFSIVLIHGGPGAFGEMAPVAQKLSSLCGIYEPSQTECSIEGQLLELKTSLEKGCSLPVVLIGFSWGAWLSVLFTARYPSFVKKLILISSSPFEESYAKEILKTRQERLSPLEQKESEKLKAQLKDPLFEDKNGALLKLGELFSKVDTYDPIEESPVEIECRYDIYETISKEAHLLRQTGKLLQAARHISCPVVAIHGAFDSHPADGVEKPLQEALNDFEFILLEYCGHSPWKERKAQDLFYKVLEREIFRSSQSPESL